MEIEITIQEVTRKYRGNDDALLDKDWNKTVQEFIHDVKNYKHEII